MQYSIKPVFDVDEAMCGKFADLELLCDDKTHTDWYKESCKESYIQCKEQPYSFTFVALQGQEIIGFTNGYLSGSVMRLDTFFVNRAYQGYGVGTNLLKTTEKAASIIRPFLYLEPLKSAVSFYERYNYQIVDNDKCMIKELPTNFMGIVPVFEWTDELQAKSNVRVDCDLLQSYKYQPMFAYVGKKGKIDGIGVLLPNGEKYIQLDEYQKGVEKYCRIGLSQALEICRQ